MTLASRNFRAINGTLEAYDAAGKEPATSAPVEMTFSDLFHGCSADWVADSYRWRGTPLLGEHAHWCDEWDGLPIDETSIEWPCQCCVGEPFRRPAASIPDS